MGIRPEPVPVPGAHRHGVEVVVRCSKGDATPVDAQEVDAEDTAGEGGLGWGQGLAGRFHHTEIFFPFYLCLILV